MSEILDASEWEPVESEYKPDPSQIKIEVSLASLHALVPELTKAANRDGQDTTTLFALACMARLIASEHAMDLGYQIALVSDVLRQRLVSGYVGDAKSAKEFLNHLHPPEFLRKVRLFLTDKQAKALSSKLVEHQLIHDQTSGYWWAWSTPTRVQFAEEVRREYDLRQEDIEYE
tara:strand:- start:962 stop:1483 length:522 start_codon:yes stop_codon:yes gene_type:complete